MSPKHCSCQKSTTIGVGNLGMASVCDEICLANRVMTKRYFKIAILEIPSTFWVYVFQDIKMVILINLRRNTSMFLIPILIQFTSSSIFRCENKKIYPCFHHYKPSISSFISHAVAFVFYTKTSRELFWVSHTLTSLMVINTFWSPCCFVYI